MNQTTVAIAAVSGMLVMGYGIISTYFLRFWRDTRDRLFLLFALAFVLLAVQRLALIFTPAGSAGSTWLYLLRLFAFLLIVYAIIDKNRR
jgi:hypothetical protein